MESSFWLLKNANCLTGRKNSMYLPLMEANQQSSTYSHSLPFPLSLFLITPRSAVMDHISGRPWPAPYDGRAIITDSYKDHLAGLSVDENSSKYTKAVEVGDHSRNIIWA
jgi:hypothetical protein